jgi:hypothetical protein
MNIAKRKRCQNTTSEQYEEYVKLMETDDIFRSGKLTPTISPNYSRLKLQKTTCHLQQHFFNIFEPNKGTKGPENHSLD